MYRWFVSVKKTADLDSLDEAPLYIRWSPDRSPYAIELRLELVSKIVKELAQAEKQGVEIGGVLVGSFPDAYMPTLRIEDVEMIPRESGEGATFLLDPEQFVRFSAVRWGIRGHGTAAVGLFRSHMRGGSLRPSLADRNLLSAEFKQPIYAALLIQGRSPHAAAFFVAANGQLPDETAVREFRFNESEFRALPEVEPEAISKQSATQRRQKLRTYGMVAALLLIGVAACVLMWSFTKQATMPQWLRPSHQLRLAVTGYGRLLRISWNHAARDLDGTLGATLVINDGTSRREIKLGIDELRLGSIEYDRATPHVAVTLALDKAGAPAHNESADWNEHP